MSRCREQFLTFPIRDRCATFSSFLARVYFDRKNPLCNVEKTIKMESPRIALADILRTCGFQGYYIQWQRFQQPLIYGKLPSFLLGTRTIRQQASTSLKR
ncbi:LOW QUALITY PROTEIN: hypothetical protein CVT26_008032 [Gymnopilus dilepis]|uniref:Uncharacterized protein n=1 Tax=Gymnopilus dilepis TaxID=231916 RepID=A0A409YJF7_9AGAR|nr:LOW QUALITY PROTEIN: hypothetical protein CVT26_008032 [Gymnopilus dilepis]